MFAQPLRGIDPGEDSRLPGGALRATGQAKLGIGGDQFGMCRREATGCGDGPLTIQQTAQGRINVHGQRINGGIIGTHTHAVEEKKDNALQGTASCCLARWASTIATSRCSSSATPGLTSTYCNPSLAAAAWARARSA